MPQSKELTEFYQAYAKWLDEGAPNWEPFRRDCGLCLNLYKYTQEEELLNRLDKELWQQFEDAGLNVYLPFNIKTSYRDEKRTQTCFENPLRIKWVRDHCNPQD